MVFKFIRRDLTGSIKRGKRGEVRGERGEFTGENSVCTIIKNTKLSTKKCYGFPVSSITFVFTSVNKSKSTSYSID